MSDSVNSTLKLGVIGSPITHSLSPQIHRQFAQQFAHPIDYQKYQVEAEQLPAFVESFFSGGGHGLNVTLPHKVAVADLVDQLSDAARLTGSVNTLYLDTQGRLVGDTTDGQGLLLDLERRGFSVAGQSLLVVGAGGATNAILGELLAAGAKVQLLNRTQGKVDQLIARFQGCGEISRFQQGTDLHGVISSVSEFNLKLIEPVADSINERSFCYDLNYGQRAEAFLGYCTQLGATRCSDGLGMLLGQAAFSYQRWTGCLPSIEEVRLD